MGFHQRDRALVADGTVRPIRDARALRMMRRGTVLISSQNTVSDVWANTAAQASARMWSVQTPEAFINRFTAAEYEPNQSNSALTVSGHY